MSGMYKSFFGKLFPKKYNILLASLQTECYIRYNVYCLLEEWTEKSTPFMWYTGCEITLILRRGMTT